MWRTVVSCMPRVGFTKEPRVSTDTADIACTELSPSLGIRKKSNKCTSP
jgi:hypothetical protein